MLRDPSFWLYALAGYFAASAIALTLIWAFATRHPELPSLREVLR